MKYTLSVLVENQPGVLSRVVSLFSRRGYNIDSLAVGTSEDPTISRITIVGEGENYTLEQVKKQLNKIIPVIKVKDLSGSSFVSGELMLLKIGYDSANLSEINHIVELMKAEIAEVSKTGVTVKFSGEHEKCETLFELLKPFGIKEAARTGVIALEK